MPKQWTRKQIESIVRLSSLINSSLDIIDVLNNSMRVVEELVDAEASSIFEMDTEHNELFFRLVRGEPSGKLREVRMKMGEGIAGFVASSEEPLIVNNVAREKRFARKMDELTGFRTRSVIALPLFHKGRITGVLEVLNKRKSGFDASDLEMLTIIANAIGIAMENASLYSRIREKFALTRNELMNAQARLIRSERMAALGKMSQGVAHNVRNPVMSIGGFTNRILKKLPAASALRGYAESIIQETERLEQLVRDVDAVASIPLPKPVKVKMSTLLNGALQSWRGQRDAGEIQIVKDLTPDDPVVFLDKRLITDALLHILDNAADAMPGGGTIIISTRWEDCRILIAVRDTGCGIKASDLPYVLDPFFTAKTHGSGLGLTAVNRIISDHGGEVRIESERGKGTELRLYLPPFQSGTPDEMTPAP